MTDTTSEKCMGLLIKLSDSCMILWDGNIIRHCTSIHADPFGPFGFGVESPSSDMFSFHFANSMQIWNSWKIFKRRSIPWHWILTRKTWIGMHLYTVYTIQIMIFGKEKPCCWQPHLYSSLCISLWNNLVFDCNVLHSIMKASVWCVFTHHV